MKYEHKDLLTQISDLIEKGVLTNFVYKQILSAIGSLKNKNDITAIIECFENNIPTVYFKERKSYKIEDIQEMSEVIILSEYFVKEM